MRSAVLTAGLTASLALAACGSDDKSAPPRRVRLRGPLRGGRDAGVAAEGPRAGEGRRPQGRRQHGLRGLPPALRGRRGPARQGRPRAQREARGRDQGRPAREDQGRRAGGRGRAARREPRRRPDDRGVASSGDRAARSLALLLAVAAVLAAAPSALGGAERLERGRAEIEKASVLVDRARRRRARRRPRQGLRASRAAPTSTTTSSSRSRCACATRTSCSTPSSSSRRCATRSATGSRSARCATPSPAVRSGLLDSERSLAEKGVAAPRDRVRLLVRDPVPRGRRGGAAHRDPARLAGRRQRVELQAPARATASPPRSSRR